MILSHHKQYKDHACPHWHVGEAKPINSEGMSGAFENGAWKYLEGGPVVEHRDYGETSNESFGKDRCE